jgi:hypothetical protein
MEGKIAAEVTGTLCKGVRKSIALLEDFQSSHCLPSDRNSMKMKTLEWQEVST